MSPRFSAATSIAGRSPDYIIDKIRGEKAVVAMYGDRLIGFSYIESWGHGDYVATSGLIVDPSSASSVLRRVSRTRHSNLPDDDSPSQKFSPSPLRCL